MARKKISEEPSLYRSAKPAAQGASAHPGAAAAAQKPRARRQLDQTNPVPQAPKAPKAHPRIREIAEFLVNERIAVYRELAKH